MMSSRSNIRRWKTFFSEVQEICGKKMTILPLVFFLTSDHNGIFHKTPRISLGRGKGRSGGMYFIQKQPAQPPSASPAWLSLQFFRAWCRWSCCLRRPCGEGNSHFAPQLFEVAGRKGVSHFLELPVSRRGRAGVHHEVGLPLQGDGELHVGRLPEQDDDAHPCRPSGLRTMFRFAAQMPLRGRELPCPSDGLACRTPHLLLHH